MNTNSKGWKKLFLCCLGLFAGTAFCMKWMEADLLQNGQTFTVIGLEITYPKEKVLSILSGLDEHVKTILRYHLSFDFVFMAGVYPGIAALCMMARNRSYKPFTQKLLLLLAILQVAAWGFDIVENLYLLKWMKNAAIGNEFTLYHSIVAAKWIIALGGALIAIPLVLIKKKPAQQG